MAASVAGLSFVAAACSTSFSLPRVDAPAVVAIRALPAAPALTLQPASSFKQRSVEIVIAPTPPLRPVIAPAVVLDGRLWCPQATPTGGSTLPARLPEIPPANVVRIERLTGTEGRRYTIRCGAPADGALRIVTGPPAER